jgi:hypothetical protein
VRFVDPYGLCSGQNDQELNGLEFKPGTTEEEKRLIRQSINETTHAIEWILIAVSLGEGALPAAASKATPKLVVKTLAELENSIVGGSRVADQLPRTAEEISFLQRVMRNAGIEGKDAGGKQIMLDKQLRNVWGELTEDAKWAVHAGETEIHYWIDKATEIAHSFKIK